MEKNPKKYYFQIIEIEKLSPKKNVCDLQAFLWMQSQFSSTEESQ